MGVSSSQITSPSPPSSDRDWKYDVFLSFRGPDTRKGITSDLYKRLQSSGVKTFMDDPDLQVGDAISRTLIEAIEGSRFAIVILSPNYASSAWCLEELAKICDCMEDQNRILPLFYDVEPTDVRFQKNSFEQAFSKHVKDGRHKSEKVKQWRDALYKVATFSGWNTNDHKTHKELIEVIVAALRSKLVLEAFESTGDFQAFEATRQAVDEVQEALKDDKVTAVGVYGMGGVGKTTLVEHVGVQARKNAIFDYVTKGVVSQNLDIEKFQHALADQLGFELHERTERAKAARLKKEIMRREKILIILDDIWERTDLSRIGIPSHKELQMCKSKVLLTTRIRNVCHAMECQRKIALNVLSEQDSWAFFVIKAGRSFESPTFEGVAKKIAGECGGLPIALIAVARALGDKDLVEWKIAVQRLEKSQTANLDDYGEASKCIKLSYDYLKDEDCKSYFLLCCLFPEDYDIEKEKLFGYAIGRGLFRDAETLGEARDRADSVAKHLIYSSLLLDNRNSEFVKVHDVVRDAAIQIAHNEDGFLVKSGCRLEDWPPILHKDYSAISLTRNYICKLPKKLVCPKLQILLLNRNFFLEEIPKTFFQSANELRVLDLSFTSLSLLPQSLGLLTELRALYLDKCDHLIIGTSILGKLKNLEILSIRDSSGLKELSKEIGGLTNLRLLEIWPYKIPAKIISKLCNLEELYMQGFWGWGSKVKTEGEKTNAGFDKIIRKGGSSKWGRGKETNAGFDEVTSLSKIRVLKVSFSNVECFPKYVEFNPKWVEFDIRIGQSIYDPDDPMGKVKSLALKDSDRVNSILMELDVISRLPEWFRKEIMKLAERISWEGCRERLIDIFVESEHGRLQALKQLDIQGQYYGSMDELSTITWVPKKSVFENLEVLKLLGLDCTGLCALELAPGSLSNLKSLEKIEYVFGYEPLLVPKPFKMRKIDLINLPVVRSMCDGPAPPATFQNLQSLSIKSCEQLEGSLFTYDVAQCLSQLNRLSIYNCPFLKSIVEASNKKIILPKLKQLSLKDLPMLYYESASFFDCPSLEELSIHMCNQLQGSLFAHDVAQCLSQLNSLELYDCPLLEGIVEASNKKIILSNLKKISLKKLPMLYYESARFFNIECPSLEELSIDRCKQLQGSLFAYDVAQCLSQLNSLTLYDCPLLERIVKASNKTIIFNRKKENKKIIFPRLKKLNLSELPMLCYESATFEMECPSLEYLYVWNCPKFSAYSPSDFRSENQVQTSN